MAFPSYPSGQAASGTLFQIANSLSPETFSTVARISDITGPQPQRKVVNTTSHSTVPAGGGPVWETKIPTTIDAGKISFKLFIKTDNANDRLLMSYFVAGTQFDFRVVEPDSLQSVIQGTAFFTAFKLSHPVSGVVEAACEIEATGPLYLFE